MNKSDVYKIIGYQGEYNSSVKKALRKLLKENHPDIGGNVDNFKIINEVKKELEENKVSINITKKNTSKNLNDIDYQYCLDKKKELENKRKILQKKMQEIKENLNLNIENYSMLYSRSLDKENTLYDDDKSVNYLMTLICVITTLLILSIVLIFISKNYSILIISSIFVVLLVIYIMMLFKKINNENSIKNEKLDDYFNIVNEIKINKKIKKELNNQKIELERKINQINNDIRFYDNILKNK